MEWERDQDGDSERHGYAEIRRRVRENATPDERVQRAIVGALFKKFRDEVLNFEHGIVVDHCHIHCLGIQIAATIGMVQQAETPALELVPA